MPSASSSHPTAPSYVGRFAPSPTGPLHFGSLISALASYLDARASRGQWLLRIEDIDPPREQPGATAAILASLRAHGLDWDGDVLYQSRRLPLYRSAAERLVADHAAFYCTCSRQQRGAQKHCACRTRHSIPPMPAAIRLAVADVEICFTDAVQGRLCERVDEAVGDFVIYRKEQLPAYQLAVVIDDADQGITHIVRGSDLLDNTPRQILLQRTLQLRSPQPAPHYMHVPVIANAHGQKLSKQTYARALADDDAVANLCAALDFLGQTPPAAARRHVRDLLDAAIARWTPAQIPPVRQLSGAALPPSCRPFAA